MGRIVQKFDSLPRAENLLFNMNVLSHDPSDVYHMYENFQGQKVHTKIVILQSLGNDSPFCFSQLHLLVDLECHFCFVGLLDLNSFQMFK